MNVNEILEERVEWQPTGDPLMPLTSCHDGVRLDVRINDFPEDPLYTLLADGEEAGDLEDWPSRWIRPDTW